MLSLDTHSLDIHTSEMHASHLHNVPVTSAHLSSFGRSVLMVCGGALLVTLTAQLQVALPTTLVPLSLQTLSLFLIAATMPPTEAVLSQGLYVGLAAIGVPVLAGSPAGIGVLVGPTLGYLLAFPLATWLMALAFARVSRRHARRYAGLIFGLGSLLILACGATWLGLALRLSPSVALAQGVTPFLVGELIKVSLASTATRLLSR
jgi:biotin transport system substrate-specific component